MCYDAWRPSDRKCPLLGRPFLAARVIEGDCPTYSKIEVVFMCFFDCTLPIMVSLETPRLPAAESLGLSLRKRTGRLGCLDWSRDVCVRFWLQQIMLINISRSSIRFTVSFCLTLFLHWSNNSTYVTRRKPNWVLPNRFTPSYLPEGLPKLGALRPISTPSGPPWLVGSRAAARSDAAATWGFDWWKNPFPSKIHRIPTTINFIGLIVLQSIVLCKTRSTNSKMVLEGYRIHPGMQIGSPWKADHWGNRMLSSAWRTAMSIPWPDSLRHPTSISSRIGCGYPHVPTHGRGLLVD